MDGTITPCWSYAEHRKLWSRKHSTTGFNVQLICLLNGDVVYISDFSRDAPTTALLQLLHQQEGGHGRRRPVCCSDGQREFGEGCWDPVVRVDVEGQFLVTAAQVGATDVPVGASS